MNKTRITIMKSRSQKGKTRISEHGYRWLPGEIMNNSQKYTSVDNGYVRWVDLTHDKDFEIESEYILEKAGFFKEDCTEPIRYETKILKL